MLGASASVSTSGSVHDIHILTINMCDPGQGGGRGAVGWGGVGEGNSQLVNLNGASIRAAAVVLDRGGAGTEAFFQIQVPCMRSLYVSGATSRAVPTGVVFRVDDRPERKDGLAGWRY